MMVQAGGAFVHALEQRHEFAEGGRFSEAQAAQARRLFRPCQQGQPCRARLEVRPGEFPRRLGGGVVVQLARRDQHQIAGGGEQGAIRVAEAPAAGGDAEQQPVVGAMPAAAGVRRPGMEAAGTDWLVREQRFRLALVAHGTVVDGIAGGHRGMFPSALTAVHGESEASFRARIAPRGRGHTVKDQC